MTDSNARERYLEEAFGLDPVESSAQIIALRRDFHDPESLARTKRLSSALSSRPAPVLTSGAMGPDLARTDAERVLREVHESFWESESGEAGARLLALALVDMPDLRRYRDRLLRVDELRRQLDSFESEPGVHQPLAETLRAILIAPERLAVEMRNRYVRGAATAQRQKANKRSLKLLQRYPELYELEAQWFSRILRSKKDKLESRELGTRAGIGFLGIYLLIKLVVELTRRLAGE